MSTKKKKNLPTFNIKKQQHSHYLLEYPKGKYISVKKLQLYANTLCAHEQMFVVFVFTRIYNSELREIQRAVLRIMLLLF